MTRDSDIFIPLRRARGHRARASRPTCSSRCTPIPIPMPTSTGFRSTPSRMTAAPTARRRRWRGRENQSDVIAGVDLSGDEQSGGADPDRPGPARHHQPIVAFRRRPRSTSSASATDILARSPHRSASLAVLVAPDVPAVLIELGYLSNSGDAAPDEHRCAGATRWRRPSPTRWTASFAAGPRWSPGRRHATSRRAIDASFQAHNRAL